MAGFNHPSGQYMDITSANVVMTLQAAPVIPLAIRLQNFTAEAAAAGEDVVLAESRMGIDGGLAMGYTPTPKNVTVNLEASSPSRPFLEALWQATVRNRTTYNATLIIELPALSRRYVYTTGGLIKGTAMPSPKKVLDPTAWTFVFAELHIETAL